MPHPNEWLSDNGPVYTADEAIALDERASASLPAQRGLPPRIERYGRILGPASARLRLGQQLPLVRRGHRQPVHLDR